MYPFIVNRWSRADAVNGNTSNEDAAPLPIRALSHAHSDHMQGLESYAGSFYASQVTKDLVLLKYPAIHPGRIISLDYDRPYQLNRSTVTMCDAGHCPGSSMFIYEGNYGNVLHTGDARLEASIVRKLPERVLERPRYLDRVFLDATFGGRNVILSDFPTRDESVEMALKVIYMHPFSTHPLVHLNAMMLGTDSLVKALSEYFLVELYCPPSAVTRRKELEISIGEKYVTEDPSSTFMELWDPTIPTRTDAVSIKPSTQYFAIPTAFAGMRQVIQPGITRDRRDGAYRILFAMHSSRNELRAFVDALRPRNLTMTAGSLML